MARSPRRSLLPLGIGPVIAAAIALAGAFLAPAAGAAEPGYPTGGSPTTGGSTPGMYDVPGAPAQPRFHPSGYARTYTRTTGPGVVVFEVSGMRSRPDEVQGHGWDVTFTGTYAVTERWTVVGGAWTVTRLEGQRTQGEVRTLRSFDHSQVLETIEKTDTLRVELAGDTPIGRSYRAYGINPHETADYHDILLPGGAFQRFGWMRWISYDLVDGENRRTILRHEWNGGAQPWRRERRMDATVTAVVDGEEFVLRSRVEASDTEVQRWPGSDALLRETSIDESEQHDWIYPTWAPSLPELVGHTGTVNDSLTTWTDPAKGPVVATVESTRFKWEHTYRHGVRVIDDVIIGERTAGDPRERTTARMTRRRDDGSAASFAWEAHDGSFRLQWNAAGRLTGYSWIEGHVDPLPPLRPGEPVGAQRDAFRAMYRLLYLDDPCFRIGGSPAAGAYPFHPDIAKPVANG